MPTPTEPSREPALLNVREVAEVLRVHQDTVKLYLRQGRLRGTKVGKSWRIPRAAIDELVERKPAAAEAGDEPAALKRA